MTQGHNKDYAMEHGSFQHRKAHIVHHGKEYKSFDRM